MYTIFKGIGYVIGWIVGTLVRLIVKLVTWPFRLLLGKKE